MALSPTSLTVGVSGASSSTFNTASITPTANALVLITVASTLVSGNGPGAISTITGNSLTYVNYIPAVPYGAVQGTGNQFSSESWRSMGASPTTGAITITFGVSVTSATWLVTQFTGTDTTGTNGSGAIGTTATNPTTTNGVSPATVTMGAFQRSTSGTYGVQSINGTSAGSDKGVGFTFISWNPSNSPTTLDEWASSNVSPVTSIYTGSAMWAMFGTEIKIPASNTHLLSCVGAGS